MDDKEEKEKRMIDISITSDIELENTWIFDLIKENGIQYTKTYINADYLYELEYLPSKKTEDYLFKYTFYYDLDDDYHNFTRYLINRMGDKVLDLECLLEDEEDTEDEQKETER